MQVPALSAHGKEIGPKTCIIVFLVLRSEIVDRILAVVEGKKGLWYNDLWND